MLTHPTRSDGPRREARGAAPTEGRRDKQPGWVEGLRQLYNSVLDEPLPKSFDELLKKLDREEDEGR